MNNIKVLINKGCERMKSYWCMSCLGSVYDSSKTLSQSNLDCDQCGDSDTYIGYFETEGEAIKALNEYWDSAGG